MNKDILKTVAELLLSIPVVNLLIIPSVLVILDTI